MWPTLDSGLHPPSVTLLPTSWPAPGGPYGKGGSVAAFPGLLGLFSLSVSYFVLLFKKVYLFKRQSWRETDFPSNGSCPQRATQPGLGHAKSRTSELHLCPHKCRDPSTWASCTCLPRYVSWKQLGFRRTPLYDASAVSSARHTTAHCRCLVCGDDGILLGTEKEITNSR